MSPSIERAVREAAPQVRHALRRAGMADRIVGDRDGVAVRTPFHDKPQVLHDVDDVRWLALDIAHGGRPA